MIRNNLKCTVIGGTYSHTVNGGTYSRRRNYTYNAVIRKLVVYTHLNHPK